MEAPNYHAFWSNIETRWVEPPPDVLEERHAASLAHPDAAFIAPNLDVTTWFHRSAADSDWLLVEHIPDARFVTIRGAGHSSSVEQPQAVTDALAEFYGV